MSLAVFQCLHIPVSKVLAKTDLGPIHQRKGIKLSNAMQVTRRTGRGSPAFVVKRSRGKIRVRCDDRLTPNEVYTSAWLSLTEEEFGQFYDRTADQLTRDRLDAASDRLDSAVEILDGIRERIES
jgi:hypothetical protein